MKMKYLIGTFLSLTISLSALAQNSPGVDYFSLGETKLAKEYFTKNIGQNPEEAHYYLGEIALLEGNMAEAGSQYEQSASANPELGLGATGLAKLQLKSNQKAAEDQLKEIQKKNKKNIKVLLAIAKAYADNGMKDKAQSAIDEAKKGDKKSPDYPYIYIFEGDMLAKENNPGAAAGLYDQAINADANCVLAYMKDANVYEFINRNAAVDLLKKAIAIKPEYKIASKDLADLYYRDGFYPEAIAAYKEFFAGGDYTVDDITRYAACEYFTKGYAEARNLINEGLKRESNNFVLNRLAMYVENDTKNYQEGLAAGDKFFSLPRDTVKYIVSDYMAYGEILSETGNKAKAIEQYQKAIELDPTKVSVFKDIATTSAKDKQYSEAADYYKKYIELMGEKADAADYSQLGSYYLSAGVNVESNKGLTPDQIKAQALTFYKEADAAFAMVTERKPDSYLGFYQRARTNYQMDPESEQGLAKPYYEQTVNVLLATPEPNKNVLIEAYSYLSYYYYLQYEKSKKADDKASVKTYAEKVLELDPENNSGKQLFDWASGK
jgi:tetratricopeptide (TPR) repeat protein